MRDSSIVIALPHDYGRPQLVRSLCKALDGVGPAVISEVEGDRLGRTSVVIVVDGWGRTPLLQAAAPCKRHFGSPALLAILSRESCTVAEVLDAGFDDCTRWPISPVEFAARVRAALRRQKEQPKFAAIVLDPVNLSVRCGRVEASLTRGQFSVLSELVRQPRRWLTGKDLLLSALGARGHDTAQVRLHILALRRKFGAEAWRIRWRRSLGYFFDASHSRSSVPVVRQKRTQKQ